MPLASERERERRSRGHWFREHIHHRTRPPLLTVDAPAARHIAIEGVGRRTRPAAARRFSGIRLRSLRDRDPAIAGRHLTLRQKKTSLITLVPGHAWAVGWQAPVGQHLKANRPRLRRGWRQHDLVDGALGHVAPCEHGAVIADDQVRQARRH